MADTPTRTTASKILMECPACHVPVLARLAMDLTLGNLEPSSGGKAATVPADVTLVGLQVAHDCIPKATRDLGPQTPAPFRSTTTPERTTP